MARETRIKKPDPEQHKKLLNNNIFYNRIHQFIIANFDNITFIPGAEHTNYFVTRDLTLFKVEPCLLNMEKCIHISVCDYDYVSLPDELKVLVQLKPLEGRGRRKNHGVWTKELTVENEALLKIALKLCSSIYGIHYK